jgi:hypothetical protein
MKFNKLDVPYQWKDEFTKYPHGYTIFEALCSWTKQVDKMVDNINDWNDYLDNFVENFEFELQEEVKSTITKWQNEGLLDSIIESALTTELDNVKAQLAQIAHQVNATGGDDTQTIQEAIDYVDSLGGGKVLLPDPLYKYSSDIHLKEGVTLEGHERTHLECTATSKARIIFYNTTQLRNLTIDIPSNYNDSMFLLSNQYLMSVNRRENSSSSAKVKFENIKAFTPYNPNTPNKVAVEMFATRSDIANATVSGYWGITGRDCYFDGFNTMFLQKTDLTGWINANVFQNITVINFEHAVRVEKSSQSLGIDYNEFKLIIQTSGSTKDIFIDGVSSNNYSECQIYDMHVHTDSRVGTAITKNQMNGVAVPKERYAQYLLGKRFHLLGRFSKFTSFVNHVMVSMTAYSNTKTDFFIRGNDEKVERRIYGTNRLLDDIKFFKRELGNGEVEIYLYNDSDVELECNIYIESFRSFYPSPFVAYDNVAGAVELTNVEDFYPSTRGFYTTGTNENGTWVKYADGTMICRVSRSSNLTPNIPSGALYISETEEWTFPQPFVNGLDLTVHVSTTLANRWADLTATPTPTSCRYGLISTTESETTGNVFLTAIGYWK